MGFLAYGVVRVPVGLVCVFPLYVFVFLDYAFVLQHAFTLH
jgi:hypothetical protein